MFQSFDNPSSPEFGASRLADLRKVMARDRLDAYLVPRADAHQGEYVADHDARLAWLTGFTGSAGFAIVTCEAAGVFIDGRYRLQVRDQVDLVAYSPVNWPETKPADWLRSILPNGGRVGFDPWLHTPHEIEALEKGLDGVGFSLVRVDNLIDVIWADQPAPPAGRLFPWPEDLAGESSASKRARLGAELAKSQQSVAVLTQPDSIMWLLNTRGEDIPRVPVAHGFALLFADGRVDLFTRARPEPDLDLSPDVTLLPPGDFAAALGRLSGRVRIDRQTAPLAVVDLVTAAGAEVVFDRDPCVLPKACKTAAEIAGMRAAHLRDAIAMCEFLARMDRDLPQGGLTEIALVQALEGYRRASNGLRDISFDTILGSGPNGAVIHYRVNHDSDRTIGEGELIVVDSGAQYLDGTTDITRTLVRGTPPPDAIAAFTRVLQGMIGISRLRFPVGVTGGHIDAIARAPLWLAHQDYDHGTGHGVGVYLSVHEGPARISRLSDVALQPGMILSNEPGYYREGAFGIRIENLIVVREATLLPGGDPQRKMLDFETLTLVPIARDLIDTTMLSGGERDWLNAYHARVQAALGGKLSAAAEDWLARACAPL